MTQRFSGLQQAASKGMLLLPQNFLQQPRDSEREREILKFTVDHESALPEGWSGDTLKAELEHWKMLLEAQSAETLPSNIEGSMRLASSSMCPAIFRLLQLVATWPVTTCSCERSISALRRLKTYLRSTMGQERLCGLALMHVHAYSSSPIDKNKVVEKFFQRNPRRIITA